MKTKKFFNGKGVSLIETIIVISVFATLISLVTLSLVNVRSKTSVNTALRSFITDIKNQQIKAMVGDTEGRGIPDIYSVYIKPESYTLFHGANYSFGDAGNFVIKIPDGYALSTTFPSDKITFSSRSGEIENYVNGQNSIVFTESASGKQNIIRINKYGTVIYSD